MLRLAYISLLSRYIPPSAIGCVADFSPHKGKFGEAAIQQALCYRGYTSSEETSDVVLERVIARWNSERKAGMLIIGYRRIAENMSKKNKLYSSQFRKVGDYGGSSSFNLFQQNDFLFCKFFGRICEMFSWILCGRQQSLPQWMGSCIEWGVVWSRKTEVEHSCSKIIHTKWR